MAGNRRHAGGMKSAMENLKRYDKEREAAKAATQVQPRKAWRPEDGDVPDPTHPDDVDASGKWPE